MAEGATQMEEKVSVWAQTRGAGQSEVKVQVVACRERSWQRHETRDGVHKELRSGERQRRGA